eukprot:359013-Chlamydomonas_euryale.AAC.1
MSASRAPEAVGKWVQGRIVFLPPVSEADAHTALQGHLQVRERDGHHMFGWVGGKRQCCVFLPVIEADARTALKGQLQLRETQPAITCGVGGEAGRRPCRVFLPVSEADAHTGLQGHLLVRVLGVGGGGGAIVRKRDGGSAVFLPPVSKAIKFRVLQLHLHLHVSVVGSHCSWGGVGGEAATSFCRLRAAHNCRKCWAGLRDGFEGMRDAKRSES